jgi:eukaryotic-like serine/threonine-protein kinase
MGLGLKWGVGIAVALVLVVAAILALRQSPPASSSAVLRLVLPLTEDERPVQGGHLAISPDGTHIAIIGYRGGIGRIFLRSLDGMEAKEVPGTEGASYPYPVFSPDGRWLAFVARAKLKKVPISGGQPVIIGDAPSGRGIFWADDGTILHSPTSRGNGIFRVSENGGEPQAISTLDTKNGETSHRLPILLPGGKAILYTTYGAAYRDVKIVAQSLASGEKKVVVDGGSQPSFVSSGHLLYVQPSLPGTVLAATFDPVRLELTSTPVRVVDDVFTDREDVAEWAVSRDGQLVYAPGGLQGQERELVWADRMGNVQPLPFPLRAYEFPRLSPDGSKVLVSFAEIQTSLWILKLADTTLTRVTFEGNNAWPLWTPNGQRIVYVSLRNGAYTPFWKAADGSGKEERILPEQSSGQVETISPDGKVLLARCGPTGEPASEDVCTVALDGVANKTPLDLSPGIDRDTQFSPDGKWLAYTSNESGTDEIYVIPFPGRGERRQISFDGGREPRWAKNGRELFYRRANSMMSVEIRTDPAFSSGTPRELFGGPYDLTNTSTPNYDVSADGQRFLMIRRVSQKTPPLQLNFVLNWFEELKQKIPIEK